MSVLSNASSRGVGGCELNSSQRHRHRGNHEWVQQLMRQVSLRAFYSKQRTTRPCAERKTYPDRLRELLPTETKQAFAHTPHYITMVKMGTMKLRIKP